MRSNQPAVFLDRDGVLNEVLLRSGKPHPPAALADLRIYKDALPSLKRLRDAGFLLFVVTNQPDIARGSTDARTVEEIHDALLGRLPIDAIYVCDHDDLDRCACRKPRPGLLIRAMEQYGVDVDASFMIGDRWRDIEAGNAAGCKTIWIDRDYDERQPEAHDARVTSLADAVTWILQQPRLSLECVSPN